MTTMVALDWFGFLFHDPRNAHHRCTVRATWGDAARTGRRPCRKCFVAVDGN